MSLLIQGGLVVTMDAERRLIHGGFVQVADDGSIARIGPASEAPPAGAARVLDATGMVVLPGLIDACHVHSQSLLLGKRATGARRATWEQRQFASQHMDADALADAASVTAGALLRGGTTCLLNLLPGAQPRQVEATVDAMARAGIRQIQALPLAADAEPAAQTAQTAQLRQLLRTMPQRARAGMVGLALEVSVSAWAQRRGEANEATMAAAYRLACAEGVRVVARTAPAEGASPAEWREALHASGRSEILHLMELGLLDERWLLIGAEALDPKDLALVRESGCSMVCTPMAAAHDGLAPGPWPELLRAGTRCALGTDASARSPVTDMLEQMKSCILVNNASRLDATAVSCESALEMATVQAARALGLDHQLGSLEPGKRADIAVFDLRGVHTQVAHKPISTLVSSAAATDAAWVLVDGHVVVNAGRLADASRMQDALKCCQTRARTLGPLWHASRANATWQHAEVH